MVPALVTAAPGCGWAQHCNFPMPPRLSTLRQLLPVPSKRSSGLVYCTACVFWRLSGAQRPWQDARQRSKSRSASRLRRSSTLASTTAVNATREVPANLRELHEALSELNSKAASYVNLSRLQLALRGLETEDAVIRVAGTARTRTPFRR